MSNNSPTPSLNSPTLSLSTRTITCSNTECKWKSPSSSDRSDPNSELVCPVTKPIRLWKDKTDMTKEREFKCAPNMTASNNQTSTCHISYVTNPNISTDGWTPNDVSSCSRNVWYRY